MKRALIRMLGCIMAVLGITGNRSAVANATVYSGTFNNISFNLSVLGTDTFYVGWANPNYITGSGAISYSYNEYTYNFSQLWQEIITYGLSGYDTLLKQPSVQIPGDSASLTTYIESGNFYQLGNYTGIASGSGAACSSSNACLSILANNYITYCSSSASGDGTLGRKKYQDCLVQKNVGLSELHDLIYSPNSNMFTELGCTLVTPSNVLSNCTFGGSGINCFSSAAPCFYMQASDSVAGSGIYPLKMVAPLLCYTLVGCKAGTYGSGIVGSYSSGSSLCNLVLYPMVGRNDTTTYSCSIDDMKSFSGFDYTLSYLSGISDYRCSPDVSSYLDTDCSDELSLPYYKNGANLFVWYDTDGECDTQEFLSCTQCPVTSQLVDGTAITGTVSSITTPTSYITGSGGSYFSSATYDATAIEQCYLHSIVGYDEAGEYKYSDKCYYTK